MTAKKSQPEQLETDYEQSSHTARVKKSEIKQSLFKKNKQELYDTCGFDDEEEAMLYQQYVK